MDDEFVLRKNFREVLKDL